MKTYISFGATSNADVADNAERIAEQWAWRVSRRTGLSFAHALAWVRANMPIMEVRHG